MNDIITLTLCLVPYLTQTQIRQLCHIILALLSMTGRVTMLGLSRWTERGGRYRSIQRWFQTPLDWGLLLWTVIQTHLLDTNGAYVLAGDDVVVSKVGKQTHGIGRFYSSIAGRPIQDLSFVALSLIDVKQRRLYPLAIEQHLPAPKAATTTESAPCRPNEGGDDRPGVKITPNPRPRSTQS